MLLLTELEIFIILSFITVFIVWLFMLVSFWKGKMRERKLSEKLNAEVREFLRNQK